MKILWAICILVSIYALFLKAAYMSNRKKISTIHKEPTERKRAGNRGESAAALYLTRHGFKIEGRNISWKTGELDIVASRRKVLHIVEVKTLRCREFPAKGTKDDLYDPGENLHAYKLRKIARTAEWYVAYKRWEGDWQIDAALVWLRSRDGQCLVRYLPQVL
jgi:putative endonuclease